MGNKNVMDILRERGFIKQTVYEDELYTLLGKESVPFYIGFDPTADSLHIGHYIPVMAMAHMQRAGHKPYALIGGGTAMVGDPSNRTDMRQMISKQTIEQNSAAFRKQLGRFLDFEGQNAAVLVDNADWLLELNYVDFLRDVGAYFSVNRMLTAECYKARLEKGLTFLEFNYMLMQSYDFLVLCQKYGCLLQMGGNDQWSNILSGADLIRRKEQKDAFAVTLALLESSDGTKMGKTQKGALWLDAQKTSPYEFYQYFRNVEDEKVAECLKLLTFVELDEIDELTRYRDERINTAKMRLAFEVTKLIHGEAEAQSAQSAADAAFSGDESAMPSCVCGLGADAPIIDVLCDVGICATKSEARRLIDGGAIKIDDEKLDSYDKKANGFLNGKTWFVVHRGKKIHLRVDF